MTNAENEATSYAYDLAGNLATVTDPLTRVTSYGYDSVNRRNETTVPSGDSGTTLFDTAGQVELSTSPAGYVATYGYDSRGLIESITDELGNSQVSGYDAAGRLTTATDGRGNDTTFGYDPNGRLETETDPLGGVVGFGYDLAGQRTSVTDPNGAIRTFGFDDGGRLTTAVDAELRSTGYVYDAVSRRTEMTDARGVTVISTFDDAGQLTDRVSPNETQSFSYDDAGRRTAWSDVSGATSVVFDDVGRMTGITTPAGVVGYSFNDAGEQETMTQPEGVVAYGYDVNGFIDSVSDWRGDTFTMTNDPDGRALTTARSNGVDTDYGYDTAGRLTSVGHNNGAAVIDSFAYDLDGNGNRTGVTSNAGTESYTLDALNRLTAASYPGAVSEVFVYDDAGNRTSHTKTDGTTVGYTVDDTGQLVSDTTGTTYTYDLAGNLTATSAGDSYAYDDYSRTTSVTAGATTQTYGYDAAGVRVTVDGIGQLWDRNGLPTLISTSAGDNYVHAAGVARDGDDWLLADAVGSVRATVDNTGATIGTADYSVFGEQLSGAGTFGFAGEQQDPTGLIHLRARQYDPSVGRFTSVDPVQPGAPGTTGYNLYAYSGNNPTTWGDPSGRAVLTEDSLIRGLTASGTVRLGNVVARRILLAAVGIATACLVVCPAERLPDVKPPRQPIPQRAPQPSPPIPFIQRDQDLDEDDRRSDCHAKAAEAAFTLPSIAWSQWFAMNNRSRSQGRNVAAVSYCINGNFGVSAAVSGFNPPSGTIPHPQSPTFPALEIEGRNPSADAEFKIANQLYAQFGSAREASVAYVFSLIRICPSCNSVLDSYQAESGVGVVRWDAGIVGREEMRDLGNELRGK